MIVVTLQSIVWATINLSMPGEVFMIAGGLRVPIDLQNVSIWG